MSGSDSGSGSGSGSNNDVPETLNDFNELISAQISAVEDELKCLKALLKKSKSRANKLEKEHAKAEAKAEKRRENAKKRKNPSDGFNKVFPMEAVSEELQTFLKKYSKKYADDDSVEVSVDEPFNDESAFNRRNVLEFIYNVYARNEDIFNNEKGNKGVKVDKTLSKLLKDVKKGDLVQYNKFMGKFSHHFPKKKKADDDDDD